MAKKPDKARAPKTIGKPVSLSSASDMPALAPIADDGRNNTGKSWLIVFLMLVGVAGLALVVKAVMP